MTGNKYVMKLIGMQR